VTLKRRADTPIEVPRIRNRARHDLCMARPGPSRGAGRPSKGDRHLITTRVPRAVYKRFEAEAIDLDLSNSEFVALILAERYGGPAVPAALDTDQAELLAS